MKTKNQTRIAKNLSAAAKACRLTPRTLRNLRAENFPGFRPDGTVDLDVFRTAYRLRKASRSGPVELRARKLRAECERLELANAVKRDTLISRAWMAARIHEAAGRIDSFRLKSEAEHPLMFAAAAGDVPACRAVVQKIWDEIMAVHEDLKKVFAE